MNKRTITALMAVAIVSSGCNTMESAMIGAAAGAGVGAAVAGSNYASGDFDEVFGRAVRGESSNQTGQILAGAAIGALIGAFVGSQRDDAAESELVLRSSLSEGERAGPESNLATVNRKRKRVVLQPLDPAP